MPSVILEYGDSSKIKALPQNYVMRLVDTNFKQLKPELEEAPEEVTEVEEKPTFTWSYWLAAATCIIIVLVAAWLRWRKR